MTTTSTPRILATLAAVGVAGALAGCAADTAATAATTTTSSAGSAADSGESSDDTYTDGTYTATGSYTSPGGQETVTVEVTLADDVVTAVSVTPNATNPNSVKYQTAFAENVASEVVGVAIDDLSVSKVAGSSLTSGGFNDALEQIKTEAQT